MTPYEITMFVVAAATISCFFSIVLAIPLQQQIDELKKKVNTLEEHNNNE